MCPVMAVRHKPKRARSIRLVSTSASVLALYLVGRSLRQPAEYQQVPWPANTSVHLEISALVSVPAPTFW